MPRIRTGRPRGRPRTVAPDDAGFGGDGDDGELPEIEGDVPAVDLDAGREQPSEPDPDIVALGAPPEDAAGIQKWNYRMLSIMAYKAAINPKLTEEQRTKRAAALTQAAARHYPEAARKDLSEKIARDAEEVMGRKRAKAAAKLEQRSAAGGAKVIPIRREV